MLHTKPTHRLVLTLLMGDIARSRESSAVAIRTALEHRVLLYDTLNTYLTRSAVLRRVEVNVDGLQTVVLQSFACHSAKSQPVMVLFN
jgi:hypothetical protein